MPGDWLTGILATSRWRGLWKNKNKDTEKPLCQGWRQRTQARKEEICKAPPSTPGLTFRSCFRGHSCGLLQGIKVLQDVTLAQFTGTPSFWVSKVRHPEGRSHKRGTHQETALWNARGWTHEEVSQNALGSQSSGSAGESCPQGEAMAHDSLWVVQWELSPGRYCSLELATKVPELWHKQVSGEAIHQKEWHCDTGMLGHCSQNAVRTSHGDIHDLQNQKEKPLPPPVSFQSILQIQFNTMIAGKAVIFSPALVLHGTQWRVGLEPGGNELITGTLLFITAK